MYTNIPHPNDLNAQRYEKMADQCLSVANSGTVVNCPEQRDKFQRDARICYAASARAGQFTLTVPE